MKVCRVMIGHFTPKQIPLRYDYHNRDNPLCDP